MNDNFFFAFALIQFLDYFGTMAFAVAGAFKAIHHKYDIVGIIVLSIITGVGGGIIRDVIFGITLPNAVKNPYYILICVGVGIITFSIYNILNKHWNLFIKFDAIGLGVFTITGSTLAYDIYGLNLLTMSFAGTISAIGGGILRDLLVKEYPLVFVKEVYASISFLGVLLYFGMLFVKLPLEISAISSMAIVTSIRLLSIKYKWNLPRI